MEARPEHRDVEPPPADRPDPVDRSLPEDRDGAAHPAREGVRHGRQAGPPALAAARVAQPLGRLPQLTAEVANQQRRDDDQPRDDRRDQREGNRARPREDADPEAEPGDQDRSHEDGVEEHQQRRHAESDQRSRESIASQRPRRQGDAADPTSRQKPRRSQARQRDPVALCPADPRLVPDHSPEQRDVAEERGDLEEQTGGQPPGLALVQPPPGVAQTGEIRQHDVEGAEGDRGEGQADQ